MYIESKRSYTNTKPKERKSAAQRVTAFSGIAWNMNRIGSIKIRLKKICVVGLCAVLSVIGLTSCRSDIPEGYTLQKEKLLFVSDRENGQTRILLDTKCLEHSIEGTVYSSVQALDETAAAAITTGRSLYYVTADEVKLIAENVTLYHIAASGKAVAYVDADNNLNLYRAATGETEKLAENAEGYLAISPDGETVLYDVFHDDGYYELYMYHGGSTSLVEENLFTLAVSDKASYIYAYDAEGTLYVLADGEKKILGEKVETSIQHHFVFNYDLSQIIYNASGGIYLSSNGGEGQKLADNALYALPVTPQATGMMYRYEKTSTVIYQMDTFGGAVLMDSNQKLHTLNEENFTEEGIAFQVEKAVVTSDGSRLFYMKLGGIHTSDMTEPADTKIVQGISDAVDFVVTENEKMLYYVKSDGVLMRKSIEGEDEPEALAENVKKLYITPNKDTVLFLSGDTLGIDGALYAVKNGGTAKKLLDKAAALDVYYQAVYCHVSNGDSYDLYAGGGDDSFDLLISNAIVMN